MRIGCGLYEHSVKGRVYLYFWHYEDEGGRRIQVKDYLGPADADASRARALRLCEAYFRRAAKELQSLRASTVAAIRSH